MLPEEDFETWKLIMLTVTDDITSFGSMLPDYKRLMESIEETNYLPEELKLYTTDFVKDTIPTVTSSFLSTASPMEKKEDNQEDAEIASDFFKSTIKFCISKINLNFNTDYETELDFCLDMSNILWKIFENVPLSNSVNDKEKFLDQYLIQYFVTDLNGIEKCYSFIDNIQVYLNQTSDESAKSSTDLLKKESSIISTLFLLLESAIKITYLKLSPDFDTKHVDEIRERFKVNINNYYQNVLKLIEKTLKTFQQLISRDIRNFNSLNLDPIFYTLIFYVGFKFYIPPESDFPITPNLLTDSYFDILFTFLKSDFFEKHLYSLKSISLLCKKVKTFSAKNSLFYSLQPSERASQNLCNIVFFTDRKFLLDQIVKNLDVIQNIHFNKEFGEHLGNIYSFVIENQKDAISIDYLKKLWSTISFIFLADRSSFYKIFELISESLKEPDCTELTNFIVQSIDMSGEKDGSGLTSSQNSSSSVAIDKNILEFLYNSASNYKKDQIRNPFIIIRNLFYSLSFGEIKVNDDIKEFADSKLPFLCGFCSTEIIERLINEKIPKLGNDEKERDCILRLLDYSFNKDEEIKEELCMQIINFCISLLPDKSATNVLTNICTTQKVSLKKEQIEQLSNISNKFLNNILLSSGFDDEYIENFLLTAKNIDGDLYDLIDKYVLSRNKQWGTKSTDFLTSLPFEKEELLWHFSLIESDAQQKFISRLCDIYSNNDGVILTDKQMINTFLNRVEVEIDNVEKRNSCFKLLQRFINLVDETNPDIIDIKKHEYNDEMVNVSFSGIKGQFKYSLHNIILVAYYKAAQLLNVPVNNVTLLIGSDTAKMNDTFNHIVFVEKNLEFIPIVGDPSTAEIKHLRNYSPATHISHSKLMNKLISFLNENDTKDSFVLMSLLSNLPTSAPIYNMINFFYVKKKIDFEKLFPINHPKFFIYSLHSLVEMGGDLKNEIIRTNGIEYLIHALTHVNNLWLISEIMDYLKSVLDTDELIEKYSNQLFESLIRLCMCLTSVYQESCLKFLQKIKPTNILKCDPEYKIKFVDVPKKETKEDKPSEKAKPELEEGNKFEPEGLFNEFKQSLNLNNSNKKEEVKEQKPSEKAKPELEEGNKFEPEDLFNEFMQRLNLNISNKKEEVKEKKPKEDKVLKIDNEIPLSHAIVNVIVMTLIKKNVYINPDIEIVDEVPSQYLKELAQSTFNSLPIPSEYFETIFPYLTPYNYTNFYIAFIPRLEQITDTALQFMLDNLDVKSKYIDFILKSLSECINHIKDEDKKNIIFKFVFDNYFVLDRDNSINEDCFSAAMLIASKAPAEMITSKINQIGIPKFDKYRIFGNDFKPDKETTGLKNLGCSCYFNSILQQFYHCPSLRKALIEYKGDDPLFIELGKLFSLMRDCSLKFVSPKDVIDNWICWDGEKLNPRIQQDAAEFTIMMIDKLSPIIPNSMFNGKLLFKIEGINDEEGQFYTERNEPFSLLILPINQSDTLEDCLTQFNSPSFFTDKNQYYADSLKRKIDAKQSDFIQELPDHLILQLKRFEYDYYQGIRKKINSKVTLSTEIDLSRICHFKENENRCTKYSLAGVIQHMGSAMGGHYYSYVKQRDTGMWYKFNDSEVTLTTIEDVLYDSNGYDSNAYILFYDRNDLTEIDDSKIDQELAEKLQNEMKMNSYCYFYMSNGFYEFIYEISKRSELYVLAATLVLRVLPYSTAAPTPNFMEEFAEKVKTDNDFAILIQNEITDLKCLILNGNDLLNKSLLKEFFNPLLENYVQIRLIELAVEAFDLAASKLYDSSSYFKLLYAMINHNSKLKELYNDEEIERLNNAMDTIYTKVTNLMKNGITEFVQSNPKSSPAYVIQSINLSDIARIFDAFDQLPNDYMELLQSHEFLKNLYANKNANVEYFLDNYIKAQEKGLFDVKAFFKTFLDKESIHINSENLFITLFNIFKEEGFPMTWTVKFTINSNFRTNQDVVLCYLLLCKNGKKTEFLMDHFDLWVPNIVLNENYETRLMISYPIRYLLPYQKFLDEYGKIPTYNGSYFYTAEFFEISEYKNTNTTQFKRRIFDLIQCLFKSFNMAKEIIEKDDYSVVFKSDNKYRARELLRFLQTCLDCFRYPFDEPGETDETKNLRIDYTELIKFGEFLLTTGHSHPFDPHIIGILRILESNCSDTILVNSIPSEEIMLSEENIKKINPDNLGSYLMAIQEVISKLMENNMEISKEFLSKFFKLIIFNLKNIILIVNNPNTLTSSYEIIKLICNNSKYSKYVADYIDNDFENCIKNAFHSTIACLEFLKQRRPIYKYIHLLFSSLSNLDVCPSSLYESIILTNGNDNNEIGSVTCYETLFDDISEVVQSLCTKGMELKKFYETSRTVIWNYLINNTKMRLNDLQNDKKADLLNQFVNNYNFNFFNRLLDFQEQQKELQFVADFLKQFIGVNNDNIEKVIVSKLLFVSSNSFGALNSVFDFLKEKAPEKLKDANFVADQISIRTLNSNLEIARKFCEFAFDGKSKEDVSAVFGRSKLIDNLIEELNLLSFVHEDGVLEDKFDSEDEDELSSLVVPFALLMDYKEQIGDIGEKENLKNLSSKFLDILKKSNIECPIKDVVIETISMYIS